MYLFSRLPTNKENSTCVPGKLARLTASWTLVAGGPGRVAEDATSWAIGSADLRPMPCCPFQASCNAIFS